ncbi:unnamed protein product [Rhizophagus irregularis]|nr:unnamed protein product [Rhizophagus irregularis]
MLMKLRDSIDISEDDENFLINFLKDFHYKIIKENDFNNFEKNSNKGKSVELYLLAIGNNSEIKNDSLNEDFDFDQLNYDKDTFKLFNK